MLPTPSTNHVNYDRIYEPAEDSFLLLDTFSSQSEIRYLQNRFPQRSPCPFIVEIGPGSGVVLAFVTAHAQSIFTRHDVASLGIDMNSFACRATAQTANLAISDVRTTRPGLSAFFLDSIVGDLATSLRPGSVDVLIFNPPYVPTEDLPAPVEPTDGEAPALDSSAEFQRDSHLLSLSYAGGLDGMETTNRLLEKVPEILSSRGAAYILLCAQNKPDKVIERIKEWTGPWLVEKISTSGKTAGREKLCVLRIWRELQDDVI